MSENDIMQLISMPRGEKISKTLNKEQLEFESKQCQKNDSMSTKDDYFGGQKSIVRMSKKCTLRCATNTLFSKFRG